MQITGYTGFQLGPPKEVLPLRGQGSDEAAYKAWLLVQRIIAGASLLVLSPLFLLMWVLVRATSRGPFLFSQGRPGMNDEPFLIYKVRTMRPGSERKTALGVVNTDPRVTFIGRILRVLKLDELPQLWNIVRGEMAIVGPRPIPAALDKELRSRIPGFDLRYRVPPGLTSIGQVCVNDNGLGEALVEDWETRFAGELHYLRNRSTSYDVVMILLTAWYVLGKLTKTIISRKG
jgi:lipopolysaccharide/colanic/teichoic acid biosynthesis glycosyltransferase